MNSCEKPHPTLKGIATSSWGAKAAFSTSKCEKPHPTLKGIATDLGLLLLGLEFGVKNPIPP